jgi:hypothetical protein
MGKFCNYLLKGLMLVALVSLAGLGTAKADPATCTAATLAVYISTYASGCEIGTSGIVVSDFSKLDVVNGSSLGTAFLEITPISGVDGPGLEFTAASPSTNPWTSTPGYALDAEVPFEVSCLSGTACLTDLYMAMTGTSTGTGTGTDPGSNDLLTESYCLGTAPPPPSCTGTAYKQDLLYINSSTIGTTVTQTDTFAAATTEINIGKDMGADGNGVSSATSTITDVINEFSTTTPTPTPEPSSLLMLGSGLLALMGFGLRRRGIV